MLGFEACLADEECLEWRDMTSDDNLMLVDSLLRLAVAGRSLDLTVSLPTRVNAVTCSAPDTNMQISTQPGP